jgi:alpha,alpha-trehalose phosphorylase
MIRQSAFPAEPWAVRETSLDLSHLAQTESVFALGNGHIGLRGNLDEGEPFGLPGTYLAGFCETRPLESAEAAYGQPLVSETVLNVTNGKLMRLLVDDEPLDVRYGELRSHERLLDLRAGTLDRSVEWVSPTGHAVRVRTTRLVSFTQRAVAAILYEVEPLEQRLAVVVQSELVANEPLPDPDGDPRTGAALSSSLRPERVDGEERRAVLAHSTAANSLTMAAAMDHVIGMPPGGETALETHPDIARLAVTCDLEPGQTLRIV